MLPREDGEKPRRVLGEEARMETGDGARMERLLMPLHLPKSQWNSETVKQGASQAGADLKSLAQGTGSHGLFFCGSVKGCKRLMDKRQLIRQSASSCLYSTNIFRVSPSVRLPPRYQRFSDKKGQPSSSPTKWSKKKGLKIKNKGKYHMLCPAHGNP